MNAVSQSTPGTAASFYRRNARFLARTAVLHPREKAAAIEALPRRRREQERAKLERHWAADEAAWAAEARETLGHLAHGCTLLESSLQRLATLHLRDLFGHIEVETEHVRVAMVRIDNAAEAMDSGDLGAAGAEAQGADNELALVGRDVVVPLNQLLSSATLGREQRARLEANLAERRTAKAELAGVRNNSTAPAETMRLVARVHALSAAGYVLAADVLAQQAHRPTTSARQARVGRQGGILVVPPQELEDFDVVGGLDEVKERIRATIGARVERPEAAARYQVVHNGVLFHGPPGVGKTLLSRAIAGEYGMRYIRVTPLAVASPYQHETAHNVRRVFQVAADNVPCLLFLDEIDAIAGERSEQASAERREVVTELMACLEEYRPMPGLVIVAATNAIDTLDQGLREGRFDAKISVGLPDAAARAEILDIHLRRRRDAVDWEDMDLDEVAPLGAGCNGAALEGIVTLAAQYALAEDALIATRHLLRAVRQRGGTERVVVEESVSWEDVVLADDVRAQLQEILNVFLHPDLADRLGVKPPPGVLLHGPPGTGKTTVAKAIAALTATSYYEQSAAELVSKWVGESEQRVARLFTRARSHRPAIIFIDGIDALLRRRGSGDSGQSWEERVTGQFFRELDGLRGGDGVLLLGATNRVDIVDEALGQRLIPVEIGLPDAVMRVRLLQFLCRDVRVAADVNLRALAAATGGMSGGDLRRLRDTAGMKALGRVAASGVRDGDEVAISMADFRAALSNQRAQQSLAVI
jgi:transitional endoplasmic reticulum ATPase